jgi:hypothetical protein
MRPLLFGLVLVVVLCRALAPASGHAATIDLPPANAAPVTIAAQFLIEISESKTKPMAVGCVTITGDGSQDFVFDAAAVVKGNVMLLSMRYVCEPLAYAWRHAPIFTGKPESTIPFPSIAAVETLARAWFATRGIANEPRAECHAVQYTWKWLRRSDLAPSFLVTARRHLVNAGGRLPGYEIPPSCLLNG